MATSERRPQVTSRHTFTERGDIDALLARIQEAMEARGITRSALADAIERSRGTVSEWWTKKHAPDAVSLMKLPIAIGCNGHWLLTGTGSRVDSAIDQDGDASYVLGGGDALARARTLLTELEARWRAAPEALEQRSTAERVAKDVQLIERILTPPHRKKVRRVR
jgi:transcriptional regulator with XRE-family HTH domain